MPTTYNGIGTHYYGKRNLYQIQGVCESCNREAVLSSYDTTLYFVFLLIPLIPLGKKRILDECPHCTRHRAMGLEEWETLKQKAFEDVTEKWLANPLDEELAKETLKTFAGFQEVGRVREIAPKIRETFARSAETQRFIGDLYAGLGEFAEAESCYRASMTLDNSTDTREALAEALIRQNRPDEAASLLRHIVEQRDREKMHYIFLLGKSFQAVGDHEKALKVFEHCLAIVPELEKNKEFKKVRKLSEKHKGSRKPITDKSLSTAAVSAPEKRDLGGRVARILGPAVIALVLGGYFWAAYSKGQSRSVYLVSGLHHAYDVNVAGQLYRIAPYSWQEIKVPEGDIRMAILNEPHPVESQTVQIKTNFWTRPFDLKTYILNPDTLAPILYHETVYIEEGTEGRETFREPRHMFHVGQPLYVFSGLNYKFQEFPDTIRVESRETVRKRVDLMTMAEWRPAEFLEMLAEQQNDQAAIEFAKRHLELDPEVEDYIHFLAEYLEPEEFVLALQPHLELRPLRVAIHAAYQASMQDLNPDYDLAGDYAKIMEELPEDGGALYLAGLVSGDLDEREQLFMRALATPNPPAGAAFQLAQKQMSLGEWNEAAQYAAKAHELAPRYFEATDLYVDALGAAGEYDKGIEVISRAVADPAWGGFDPAELYLRILAGRDDDARNTLARQIPRMREIFDPEAVNEVEKAMRGMIKEWIAARDGDLAAYEQALAEQDQASKKLTLAVLKGDAAAADAAVREIGSEARMQAIYYTEDVEEEAESDQSESAVDVASEGAAEPGDEDEEEFIIYPNVDATDHLLVYVIAVRSGAEEIALKQLKAAIMKMRISERPLPELARLFAGETNLTPEEVHRDFAIEPREKRIYLLALAELFPENRAQYHELAKRLNVNLASPYLIIKSIVEPQTE